MALNTNFLDFIERDLVLRRFEGDLLRFEAGTQLRLDRIENRLNLSDAR
jgi:hypothetical protein